MLQNIVRLILWVLLLVLLQATLFNHIHLLGYATPLPYVYFLIKFPSGTMRVIYICSGFLVGLLIDIFSNTPGMAAATLSAVGLVAPMLLAAFIPKDRDEEMLVPSIKSMGSTSFMLYAGSVTVVHCALFFLIEAFSLSHWPDLLLKFSSSALLTFLIILAFEAIRPSKS
ncbi:MAG: rod shape-determining protein MreD [Bacteroidales bacterium]|nr:rod shape-determining protein MreD [Bacteroidales bacterium]MDY2915783.1 rod shape-determining protein MreD [Alloprevotella sp.]MCI7614564.1 rod shape-determining protein MreD [Bacteroidales bacterium]MDD6592655.1 rod shape-determining protein MreD [Bacteroidales bacterium]MDY4459237.1 rod shape-determining protein MreD [Alloprevotella sp.]